MRFRILTLDGGGIKGTFSASVVTKLEEMTGSPLAQYFDLISGTSTGGIIALGLGLGFTGKRILDFYCERGPAIFPSTGAHQRLWHAVKHAFRHKHSSKVLCNHLTEIFGARRLGESSVRLIIPCFDCNAGRVQLFKTSHHPRLVQDFRVSAVNIAMATSAAPSYFSAFTADDGQTFLDGGVWANCPVLPGLLEAIFVLGIEPSNIDVLSIGTTESPFDLARKRRIGGLLSWSGTIVKLLMQPQVDAAVDQAQVVTGRRLLRIDAVTRPGRFQLDDVRQIEELKGLGAFHAKAKFEEVADRFLQTPAEKFVPFHSLSLQSDLRAAS
jgi:patatin-like phospholipase/acyl hydrolase